MENKKLKMPMNADISNEAGLVQQYQHQDIQNDGQVLYCAQAKEAPSHLIDNQEPVIASAVRHRAQDDNFQIDSLEDAILLADRFVNQKTSKFQNKINKEVMVRPGD